MRPPTARDDLFWVLPQPLSLTTLDNWGKQFLSWLKTYLHHCSPAYFGDMAQNSHAQRIMASETSRRVKSRNHYPIPSHWLINSGKGASHRCSRSTPDDSDAHSNVRIISLDNGAANYCSFLRSLTSSVKSPTPTIYTLAIYLPTKSTSPS